jgi:ABC-2 type transport system ATP-binding protein
MANAINVQHISKTYNIPNLNPFGKKRVTEALKDISFYCPAEKISCILGPNGAGKTTTIKILGGLIEPDFGTAEVLGFPLAEASLRYRSHIGLLTPNERSFFWRLTGRQNLDFYAALYNLKGKLKKERINEVLEIVSLIDDADKPFRLYSAGMKQKLLFARAIISKPSILLLDEPTTHMDPLMRTSIHKLIREHIIGENHSTVLLCTHDLTEAQELAEHLIFLYKGVVHAEGSLSDLSKKLHPQYILRMEFRKLPGSNWTDRLHPDQLSYKDNIIEINISDPDIIPGIIHDAVLSGGEMLSCQHNEESLASLFTRFYDGVMQ